MSKPIYYTECLQDDDNKEKLLRCLHMVQMPPLDDGESLSESDESESITTEDECAVDGNVHTPVTTQFMKTTESTVMIQSLHHVNISPQNINKKRRKAACMKHCTSGEITIYYYKTTSDWERGVPVALNVSNSKYFLKCEFKEDKAVLSVESCERDLNIFYKNDPITWPFIFYLTCTKDDCRHFESAQYKGWFIRADSNHVCVDKGKDPDQFSFRIFASPNATKSK